MAKKFKKATFLFAVAFSLASCNMLLPPEPEAETVLAGPVEGLTPSQTQTHLNGDAEFGRIFGELDGLGPVFVATSCESCHGGDGKGHPGTLLTRFGKTTPSGFDHLLAWGGPQLQHRSISGCLPETIPASATGVARFLAPAVTGLGFLEAVPDSVLLLLSDSADADGDGISGRVNWILPPDYFVPHPGQISSGGKYIGRFGKKAGALNLLQQTSNAYLQDMGISSAYLPVDISNPLDAASANDPVADPEIPASVVNQVVFYMRTLKQPPRRNADNPEVMEGQELFMQAGCVKCHVPALTTGITDVAALSGKEFYPYSDLLLHDMGPELDDGYTEGGALTSEWRTAPLWGIGLAADSQGGAAFYLHDGRARSLEQAIEFHGGEGSASRDYYRNLSPAEKNKIILFIQSL